ncbi:MAG: TetR/AcrR family transcriptional regulator [Emcibacteraceae bacterium]|nr:TetR/AcrR family transcriptional regulator [Emcibacteraceae bacterium]
MKPQLGKDKILDAALQLFAKKGYHTTSISLIAKTANVSKGLTYNYFKSKEELLLAIIDQASKKMFAVAKEMSAPQNYQDTLRQFLDQFFLFLVNNKSYLRFQLSLLFQPDLKAIVEGPLQQRAELLLSHTITMFREVGAENPALTARRFISELDGIALHHLSVFKNYPLDDMHQQLFNNYKDL